MGRIVIVEDQAFIRDSLIDLCVRTGRHQIVGHADDGPPAVQVIARENPDAVILDLSLRSCSGFNVVELTNKSGFFPHFVVLSGYCDNYTTYRTERTSIRGFVSKGSDCNSSLVEALDALCSGRTFFSNAFARVSAARKGDPMAFDKILSDREIEVTPLFACGLSNEEIARLLGITSVTVQSHRKAVMAKLGLHSTPELMRWANAEGFRIAQVGREAGRKLF